MEDRGTLEERVAGGQGEDMEARGCQVRERRAGIRVRWIRGGQEKKGSVR